METIFTGMRNEMDIRHAGGSYFSSTNLLEQVNELNNNMNEILNNWKNGVDDG